MTLEFDYTITIGNVITLLGSIAAMLVAVWRVTLRLIRMEMKMSMMWRWYQKQHGIENGHDDAS